MLALRTKFDEQSAELTKLIGHQNHKQKIQLHAQIKEENNVLKREVATLKAELKRLKSTQLALESNVTTPVVGSSHKCPPMSRTRFPSNLNPQHLVPVSPAVGPPRSGRHAAGQAQDFWGGLSRLRPGSIGLLSPISPQLAIKRSPHLDPQYHHPASGATLKENNIVSSSTSRLSSTPIRRRCTDGAIADTLEAEGERFADMQEKLDELASERSRLLEVLGASPGTGLQGPGGAVSATPTASGSNCVTVGGGGGTSYGVDAVAEVQRMMADLERSKEVAAAARRQLELSERQNYILLQEMKQAKLVAI